MLSVPPPTSEPAVAGISSGQRRGHWSARVNLRRVGRVAIVFGVGFVLLQAVRWSVVDWISVPTVSMEPAVHKGAHLLVNQMAYGVRLPFTNVRLMGVGEPRKGEIAVFRSPVDGTMLLKRVAAVPGDRVAAWAGAKLPADAERANSVVLGPGEYYVLGDNAEHSVDSRSFGPVPRGNFRGRVMRKEEGEEGVSGR